MNVKLQVELDEQIEIQECKVNLQQAKKLKELYQSGELYADKIEEILCKSERSTVLTLNFGKLRKYFPDSYSPKQCEQALWKILDDWKEKNRA